MEFNVGIRKVAKEIIELPYNKKSQKQLKIMFFDIMRKYNIKQGEKNGNGRTCDNFEWTMCSTLFCERISSEIEISFMFNGIPKDLQC